MLTHKTKKTKQKTKHTKKKQKQKQKNPRLQQNKTKQTTNKINKHEKHCYPMKKLCSSYFKLGMLPNASNLAYDHHALTILAETLESWDTSLSSTCQNGRNHARVCSHVQVNTFTCASSRFNTHISHTQTQACQHTHTHTRARAR